MELIAYSLLKFYELFMKVGLRLQTVKRQHNRNPPRYPQPGFYRRAGTLRIMSCMFGVQQQLLKKIQSL